MNIAYIAIPYLPDHLLIELSVIAKMLLSGLFEMYQDTCNLIQVMLTTSALHCCILCYKYLTLTDCATGAQEGRYRCLAKRQNVYCVIKETLTFV